MDAIKTSEDLGRMIRAARVEARLTQAELATRCGVGVRFVHDLERGKATSELGKSLTVVVELGIRLGDLSKAVPAETTEDDPDDDLSNLPRFG